MSAVTDVFHDLHAFLDRRGTDWYVFGAQAVVIYGRPRQTLDVDVTVNLSADEAVGLLSALNDAGFPSRVGDIDTFVRRTRVIPLVHRSSAIPIDLILAGPGLETEFFERIVTVELEGVEIPFISPEDLIALKVLAGRLKDLDDVMGIIDRQSDALDESRIEDVLRRLDRALDRTDLLEMFQSLRRG